jgi:hypothetical protein
VAEEQYMELRITGKRTLKTKKGKFHEEQIKKAENLHKQKNR